MNAAQVEFSAYMSWEQWDRERRELGTRNFETHPLRKVKTAAQEFAAFCRELDDASSKLSAADAELLARLEALPRPSWMQAVEDYETHAQRMRAWFRQLDKNAAPLIWRPLSVERAELVRKGDSLSLIISHSTRAEEWHEKRRDEVQRVAAARGDTFAPGMHGPELAP